MTESRKIADFEEEARLEARDAIAAAIAPKSPAVAGYVKSLNPDQLRERTWLELEHAEPYRNERRYYRYPGRPR